MRLSRIRYRWSLLVLVLGLSVLASLAMARGDLWQRVVDHEQRLRRWLTVEHPIGGFLLGFVVFTLLSLVPGLAGKSIVAGWLFGFWPGLVMVNIGLTLAAVSEFWLTRICFREAIESRFGFYLRRANEALQRDGPYYLFALRVAHVPFTVTNYVMGATRISGRGFLWATQLGMLPGNVVFCYVGAKLPTLHDLSMDGVRALFTPSLIGALALLALVPLALRWLIRRVQGDVH